MNPHNKDKLLLKKNFTTMTFFGDTISCAHCIVNALCTRKQKNKKQNKTKPKAHYKCISVMVHVIKFQPKNKTTILFF